MSENQIKNNNLKKCRTCSNDLEDKPWKSEWDINHHYKTNICDKCGKKTWLKVDFLGSGDDDWKPDEDNEE